MKEVFESSNSDMEKMLYQGAVGIMTPSSGARHSSTRLGSAMLV